MQQHFLASLTSRPAGESARPAGDPARGVEGPEGEAPPAGADGAEFGALVGPGHVGPGFVGPGEAPVAAAPLPAEERAVVDPDDPLAALISAFLPDGARAADLPALPDWLRAALLGPGPAVPNPAVPDVASGAGEAGAMCMTGATAGPEGDGGDSARIGRAEGAEFSAVAGGAAPAGGLASAGGPLAGELPDGDDGMPPAGVSGTIGAGPEDGSAVTAGDRIPGQPLRDAGDAPVVAATANAAAGNGPAAGLPAGRTVDAGRGRGRIDPSDAAPMGSGQPPVPATAEDPAALRALSEAELRDVPARGTTPRSVPTGGDAAAAAVPPARPDLADPRTAAFDPAGIDRAAASVPAPAAAPDTAMPSPAVGAAEALGATAEAPRQVTPLPPVALPQLRDAMTERVRAMAEDAGNETVRLRSAAGTSEVELAPAELGRLRLQLSTTERGLHLTVLVDRPESVEVVRRHLDGLHRSLMAEGLTLDGFDIGTGGKGQEQAAGHGRGRPETPGSASGRADAQTTAAGPDAPPPPPSAPGRPATGRLDIRI